MCRVGNEEKTLELSASYLDMRKVASPEPAGIALVTKRCIQNIRISQDKCKMRTLLDAWPRPPPSASWNDTPSKTVSVCGIMHWHGGGRVNTRKHVEPSP